MSTVSTLYPCVKEFDPVAMPALPAQGEGRIALRIGEAAAAAIGVCRATFWRLMNAGEIPVVRIGGCRRILRRDLERWLEAHKEGATGD